MKIYVHKVRTNSQDGWGRGIGLSIDTLGHFDSQEKALDHKKKRDSNGDFTFCDVGNSWIEEIEVK